LGERVRVIGVLSLLEFPPSKGLGIGEMAGDWGESGEGVDDAPTPATIDA
jgi:hypothetical protein